MIIRPFKFECTCGNIITEKDANKYPHEGGVPDVDKDGSTERVWLYFHCKKCGYDWSWWKIEKRLNFGIVRG